MAHSPPHKKQKLDDKMYSEGGSTPAVVPTKVDPFKVLTSRPPTLFSQKFVTFYKAQGLFSSEEDWTEFIQTLQLDLPTTFRITSMGPWTKIVQFIFSELFARGKGSVSVQIDDHTTIDVAPPTPIPWYPNELGWHYDASKKSLRASTVLKHVKHFLNIESEIGNLSRQEAVSMIPALLLDVQPHHRVLDMCAAPGSKTCQLIEMLHANNTHHPSGVVIANDVDLARCYMLGHHTSRLGSQALLITNYEAQKFPFIRLTDPANPNEHKILSFDRVLCDVPCSGDGTIRKSADIGKTWSPKNGEQLHLLQLQIAWRGVQLVDVGGTFIYSTCAFNPIEDEAVVAHLLRVAGGALELVDVSDRLPNLMRRPGLSTWKMMDEGSMVLATKIEELADSQRHSCVTRSMFPPTEEEAKRFNLHRCIRLLPHLQNTGGFFVAVLRKVAPIDINTRISANQPTPVSSQTPEPAAPVAQVDESVKEFLATVTSTSAEQQRRKKGRRSTFKEEPFYPLSDADRDDLLTTAGDFFGLNRSSGLFEYLVTRHSGATETAATLSQRLNKVYLLNNLAYSIVANGKPEGAPSDQIRIISAGLRLFENDAKKNKRLELKCPWRLQPESLGHILPHLSKRIIPITREDLLLFLETQEPIAYEKYSPGAQAAFAVAEDLGCCVIVLDPAHDPIRETDGAWEKALFGERLTFLGWRGRNNAALWIDKLEIKSVRNMFLSRAYDLGFDPTPRRPDLAKKEAGLAQRALKMAELAQKKAAKAAAAAAAAATGAEDASK